MQTIIRIYFIRYIGTKTNMCQIEEDGHRVHIEYPSTIYDVVFFHRNENNQPVKDYKFNPYPPKSSGIIFTLECPDLKRKFPCHKKASASKKKSEKFFAVQNTLWIDRDAVELTLNYEKIDDRNGKETSLTETNFHLKQRMIWNGDSYDQDVLYDLVDYRDLQYDALKAFEELHGKGCHSFDKLKDLNQGIMILQKLVINLTSRMIWWETATTETLVQLYEERLSKLKGDEDE